MRRWVDILHYLKDFKPRNQEYQILTFKSKSAVNLRTSNGYPKPFETQQNLLRSAPSKRATDPFALTMEDRFELQLIFCTFLK